ncbi:MAG: hypothetical protein HZA20_02695 [Nitrospirae bacterium]|nr:hypothetical protein [Nitrospirota bacterium]
MLLTMSALMFTACADDAVELKNTVTAYNKLSVEALSRPDAMVMEFFATPAEITRMGSYIIFIQKDRRLLIGELVDMKFTFTEVASDRKTASVGAKEQWKFHFVDERTRKQISPLREVAYESRYDLVRTSGRWLVDRRSAKEILVSE